MFAAVAAVGGEFGAEVCGEGELGGDDEIPVFEGEAELREEGVAGDEMGGVGCGGGAVAGGDDDGLEKGGRPVGAEDFAEGGSGSGGVERRR